MMYVCTCIIDSYPKFSSRQNTATPVTAELSGPDRPIDFFLNVWYLSLIDMNICRVKHKYGLSAPKSTPPFSANTAATSALNMSLFKRAAAVSMNSTQPSPASSKTIISKSSHAKLLTSTKQPPTSPPTSPLPCKKKKF